MKMIVSKYLILCRL